MQKATKSFSVADPVCLSRIRLKELKYFSLKIVSKHSEICSKFFIPDADFCPSRILGSKRYRIPDPDPQH
jgi:hypothetical protein